MATKRSWYRRPLFHAIFWPAFIVLAPLATWLAWGWHAAHRFEATKAGLHAAGYRIYPTDFPDGDALPKEENGFNDFFEAMEGFKLTRSEEDLLVSRYGRNTLAGYQPSLDDTTKLEAVLARQRGVLDEIDAIETRPKFMWPRSVFDSAWFEIHHSRMIEPCENLGCLLSQAAVASHSAGRDIEALKDAERVMALSHASELSPTYLMQSLASLNRNYAATALCAILPGLRLDDPEVAAEAKRLLMALQDDGPAQKALAGALEAEVASVMPQIHAATQHSSVFRQPLLTESESCYLDTMASFVDVCRQPNWSRTKAALDARPITPTTGINSVLHAYEIMDLPNLRGPVVRLNKAHAASRAAAFLLAAKLHEQSHMGPAQTAADLIPDELQNLPLDPFADNDQPLQYRLDAAGPVVWSVGEDGKDDGGDPKKDLVFGLPAKQP